MKTTTKTVTIASSGTTSTVLDAELGTSLGLILPATFTGTSLSFQVCDTYGGTFQNLYDDLGNQVTLTVGQGKSYDLPVALAPWRFIKIVSGSSEGGTRTLTVVLKR